MVAGSILADLHAWDTRNRVRGTGLDPGPGRAVSLRAVFVPADDGPALVLEASRDEASRERPLAVVPGPYLGDLVGE
jgi:hypothetical protein